MMNSLQILLDKFWVVKEKDRDLYYKVRRDVDAIRRFAADLPGWRLVCNERLIRLEKIPAHPQSFMGVTSFTSKLDYMMFCALLIFLEDLQDRQPFLLSELTDNIEVHLKPWSEIDWTSFSTRRSLIRVMQFAENTGLVILHEGSLDALNDSRNTEMLYENTGISRYFAVYYPYDTSSFNTPEDYENHVQAGSDANRGNERVKRIYRNLLLNPAVYWHSNDDQDALYLKNYRRSVAANLYNNVTSRLDLHRGAAFLVNDNSETSYGVQFPDGSMRSDIILLVCSQLRDHASIETDGTAHISEKTFLSVVSACADKYRAAWSKTYREMPKEKLADDVLQVMMDWMMAEKEEGRIRLLPAVWKFNGRYPSDFHPEQAVEQKKKGRRKKEAEDRQTSLF